jgi:predicted transposase YbfD/YdcC
MTRSLAIKSHFRPLRDPRRRHCREHLFLDIIVIAICAVIGHADSWRALALWGRTHETWLRRFLALPKGIPGHDTFRRLFERLDPAAFQRCLRQWLFELRGVLKVPHIAIDGKTLRSSGSPALGPLHLVSAWATQYHLSLGQVAVEGKSNEITAIPALLELLDLHGALVTIDAMGCQKAIAQKIVDSGGDYVLTVKDNQPHLREDIEACMTQALEQGVEGCDYHTYECTERGHGREETRSYVVIPEPEGIREADVWPKLRVVGACFRECAGQGQTSLEARYFIGSRKARARYYGQALRNHWGIENNLHWQLDVSFDEDGNQTVNRRGAENLALIRKLALTLLKQHPGKGSIRNKRQQAGWDPDFLEEVLRGSSNPENS